MQCVGDCDTDHPRVFEQPVWQTGAYFLLSGVDLVAHRLNSYHVLGRDAMSVIVLLVAVPG